MRDPLDAAAALAEAARVLRRPEDLDATLTTLVTVVRDSTPGIDHAGISLAHRDGRIETRAATDEVVNALDQAQYDAGEGPCLYAMDADAVVRVEHARHEQRWPAFIAVAAEMGLRSQLGVRLHSDSTTFGALNLYSFSSDTLSDEVVQMGELFAAHIATVLGHARQIENLSAALTTRKVIGMALGLVMARHRLDEDTAFAYLTRVSASTETKLRDVAADVVAQHTRRVGEARRAGRPGRSRGPPRPVRDPLSRAGRAGRAGCGSATGRPASG